MPPIRTVYMDNTGYKLVIENKKSVTMNGVESVLGFDEAYVSLISVMGRVIIEGEGMKIESLSKESGQVLITGDITAVYFADEKTKNGMFKRLFK